MNELRLHWQLGGDGHAVCLLGDDSGGVRLPVARGTDAPEELLAAVTALLAGEEAATVRWVARGTAYRWDLTRTDRHVRLDVTAAPAEPAPAPAAGDGGEAAPEGAAEPAGSGTVLWSAGHPLRELARALLRAFDRLTRSHGPIGYRQQWGTPLPRARIEALRTATGRPGPA